MSKHEGPSCLLVFVSTIVGSIGGFSLVVLLMLSTARTGGTVGPEGLLYLLVSPIVGGVVGAGACFNSTEKR